MNSDNAIRNRMHMCVKATLTKQQVIKVVHRQNELAMLTISVCVCREGLHLIHGQGRNHPAQFSEA